MAPPIAEEAAGGEPESDPEAVWRLSRAYVQEHPWLAAGSALTLLLVPVQEVLIPHLTGRMVNAVRTVSTGKRAALAPFVAVVAVVGLLQLAYAGTDLLEAWSFPTMQAFFRNEMLRCVLQKNDTTVGGEKLRAGELMAKFMNMPYTLVFWFDSARALTPHVLVYVVASLYFAWVDRMLGMGVGAIVLLMYASMLFSLRTCGDVSHKRDEALNAVHERIDETLHNLPAIYMGMQTGAEVQRVLDGADVYRRLYFASTRCAVTLKAWMVPAAVAMVAFVLWRCRVLLAARRMTAGSFVAVFMVSMYMMGSMMRMVSYVKSLVHHWGVVRSGIGAFKQCHVRAPHGQPCAEAHGAPGDTVLAAENVWFVPRGSTKATLRGVSLSVVRGERVALVGNIGCGKSTLLRLMAWLATPASGSLSLHGVPYTGQSLECVRRSVGYVPQTPELFDRSVMDNVLYGVTGLEGMSQQDRARLVWDAATELGVQDVIREVGGPHAQVGKGGSRVSGGQRQVIWILRVLVSAPDVVLLDEPSASLDGDSRDLVVRALLRLPCTLVFSTHDAALIEALATRTVELRDGQVTARHA